MNRLTNNKNSGWGQADWSKIPSKSDSLPPQDEIKQMVRDKAQAWANAPSQKEKDSICNEVFDLFTQYVSHGSPDRKTLLNNAIKTIKEQSGSNSQRNSNPDIDTTKTLFDFITEADGKRKGMVVDKAYSFAGGGTVTAALPTVGTPNFAIAQNGVEVMAIDTRGEVNYTSTPLEQGLQKEIANIWHNACDYYMSNPTAPISSQNTENVLDIKA